MRPTQIKEASSSGDDYPTSYMIELMIEDTHIGTMWIVTPYAIFISFIVHGIILITVSTIGRTRRNCQWTVVAGCDWEDFGRRINFRKGRLKATSWLAYRYLVRTSVVSVMSYSPFLSCTS